MRTANLRSARGFTLLELMIVVTLIALMLMLAAPSITVWLQNIKVRNVGESIVSGMQLSRMEAMRRNTRATFWMVSTTDANCALSAASPSWLVALGAVAPTDLANKCAAAMVSAGGAIVQKNSASTALQGVTIAAKNASGNATNCLTYDGLGQIPTQGSIACASRIASIDITSAVADTVVLRVEVGSGGQVRLCYPDAGNKLLPTDPRKC